METPTPVLKVKAFFTKKKIIWTAVIVVVLFLFWFLFGRGGGSNSIQTGVVTKQNIEKTVLTTGQVVSSTDLDLSFQTSGVVKEVSVVEGQQVYAGQTLAVLDQSNALASLANAKASYDKIVNAATPQDVAVSEASVEVASTTLINAKQDLQNELSVANSSTNSLVLSDTNSLFSNPQSSSPQFGVAGTVQTNQQLVSNVNNERTLVNNALSLWQAELASSTSPEDQIVTDSLGYLSTVSNYLGDILTLLTSYSQANSSSAQSTLSSDQATIASAKGTIDTLSTTITNDTQAVRSAKSSLDQALASLALKQAPSRPEDVAIAQAQVDVAQTNLNNTVLRAPTSGTITQVDIKLGEQAPTLQEVMILQNVSDLHAEADVSESDIADVSVGQSIDETFDALGPDQHFTGKVLTVNPASTVISGVVDYKVTGSLDNVPNIKPGMTVNMTINVAQKNNVLAIPSSAIINSNGKQYVKVIDDLKKKTYHQVEVTTGLEADSGLTEIVSGLSEGQTIVTYMK